MFDFDLDSNEIYLYDEIGPSYYGLIDDSLVIGALKQMEGKHVTVRLNTPGGSVDHGISIYNALKRHKGGVTTVIDSLAASMGSYLAQAGEKRIIAKNSMMMVHAPWTIAFGNADQLRKDAEILDKYALRMIPEYATRTGRSDEEIKAIMDAETWYTGSEIIEAGFADSIDDGIDAEPIAAGLTRIAKKAPEQLVALAATQEKQKSEWFPKRERARKRAMSREQLRKMCSEKIAAVMQDLPL